MTLRRRAPNCLLGGLILLSSCAAGHGDRSVVIVGGAPASRSTSGSAATPWRVKAPTVESAWPKLVAKAPVTTVANGRIALSDLPVESTPPPVSVRIAAIGLSGAPVLPTEVDPATGELAIPPEAKLVTWYRYGPSPGDPGSAVLAGHVDWHGRPGSFFRLGTISDGATVVVDYSDGTSRHFRVVSHRLMLKGDLPAAELFARHGPPQLVLITCGGDFDRSIHHYRSNVIVIAKPVTNLSG